MSVGSCQAIAYGPIKTRLLFLFFLTPTQPLRSYQGKHLNNKKKKKEEEAEKKKKIALVFQQTETLISPRPWYVLHPG